MHADDNFVRSERPFEVHFFHSAGNSELTLPAGAAEVEVMKGFKYAVEKKRVLITRGRRSNIKNYLKPISLQKESQSQCISGAVHVHMNYGGVFHKESYPA